MAAPFKASMCLATTNNYVLPGSLSNDFLVYVGNSNQDVLFGVSNVATYMCISSNVGIGTITPAFKLDVTGGIRATGTLAVMSNATIGSNLSVSGVIMAQQVANAGPSVGINGGIGDKIIMWPGNAGAHPYSIGVNSDNTMWSSVPTGATMKSYIGGNIVTTMNSTGLGIGTTTPAYKLDVVGDINYTGILRQNGVAYIGSQWSNSGANVFITGSNVGIGTTAPAFNLDVTGTIRSTGALTAASFSGACISDSVTTTSSTVAASLTAVKNAYDTAVAASSGGQFTTSAPASYTASAALYRGGQVYMGMVYGRRTVGNTSLTANTDTNASVVVANEAGGGGNTAFLDFFTYSSSLSVNPPFRIAAIDDASASAHLAFLSRNSGGVVIERMRITSTGNLGIGISTPAYKLDVSGDINYTGTLRQNGTAVSLGGSSQWTTTVPANYTSLSTLYYGGPVNHGTLNVTGMISASGVIMGQQVANAAPSFGFSGGAGDKFVLWQGNAGMHPHSLGVNSDNTMWYSSPSGGNMKWYIGGNIVATMSGNNFGIGTTSPAYPLDVNGSVNISGKCIVGGNNFTAPSIGITGGAGDKLIMFPGSASSYPYSIGVEGGIMWFSAPSGSGYKWYNNGTQLMILNSTGALTTTGAITAFSDIRYKTNLKIIDNALNKVDSINGYTFERINKDDVQGIIPIRRHAGVIAQEIEKILPEVVYEDNENNKSVAYGNLTALLIEAIKELKIKYEDVCKELIEIKSKL